MHHQQQQQCGDHSGGRCGRPYRLTVSLAQAVAGGGEGVLAAAVVAGGWWLVAGGGWAGRLAGSACCVGGGSCVVLGSRSATVVRIDASSSDASLSKEATRRSDHRPYEGEEERGGVRGRSTSKEGGG